MTPSLTVLTACDPPRGVPHEKDYQACAVRLARSVRRNGGAYSTTPIVCVHAAELDAWAASDLRALDVDLRHVKTPVPNHPSSMMCAAGVQDINTEFGLVVDSDVFFLGDLSAFFDVPADVRAAPTTHAVNRWANDADIEDWRRIDNHLGVRVDRSRRLRTTIDEVEGCFYLSAGAILFRHSTGIQHMWADFAESIFHAVDAGALPESCGWVPTETAITTAVLASSHLSFEPLPERLHLVYALRHHTFDDTIVVHYQENRVVEAGPIWGG